MAIVTLGSSLLALADGDPDTSDESIAVEYVAPEEKGDPYLIAFPVPPGHAGAVVVMKACSCDVPQIEDLEGAWILPAPVDPATSLAVLQGLVPSALDIDALRDSALEFRALVADLATGAVSISDGFPVVPDPQPEPNEDPTTAPGDELSAADLVSMAADPEGDPGETQKSTSGGGTPSGGAIGNFGGSLLGPLHLRPLFPYPNYVHDQPAPIHGSGH